VEFLLGFILAIATVFVFRFFIIKDINQSTSWAIRYSQTRIHEIIKNYVPDYAFEIKKPITQSENHKNSMYTRVVFVENQAYWIKNNTLFVADMEEGMVDEETTREVDTMAMDKVQLEKVIHIVEALTEGKQR
jgi:predicted small secreted protein